MKFNRRDFVRLSAAGVAAHSTSLLSIPYAMAAGATDAQVEALAAYGKHLGLATTNFMSRGRLRCV